MSAGDEMVGSRLEVEELLTPSCYPHAAPEPRLIETHISWVVLAGDYAYKLKKPVDLGFLDFTASADREHFCREELRLNRRLAPDLYVDVVPLRRSGGRLRFGDEGEGEGEGEGEIVEYAVRMRRFDQECQLDRRLEAGLVTAGDIDAVADLIGRFHQFAPIADAGSEWGRPEAVIRPVRENFVHLGPAMEHDRRRAVVERLRRWSEDRFVRVRDTLLERVDGGRIRECHGDLHLRNMAKVDDGIVAFDGIEFDPALRWIDVISDCAFLIMDLDSRGRRDLAWRFLNRWLVITGDFAGLALLRWYLVYRHMVRAKVDAIRLAQADVPGPERERLLGRIDTHLSLALETIVLQAPFALLMHGVSGSGKSWLAERLAMALPAVWIRSDVERKRLFGMAPLQRPDPGSVGEIYAADTTARIYETMAELALSPLEAGLPVILDATFLDPDLRRRVTARLRRAGAPVLILACEADADTLHSRVARRRGGQGDPSDADTRVLEQQLLRERSFGRDEILVPVRTDEEVDVDALRAIIGRHVSEARR